MQEFIDNIKGFAEFIIFLITLPFKFAHWLGTIRDWFEALPDWINLILDLSFLFLFILFVLYVLVAGVSGVNDWVKRQKIYVGPRGGFYRINKNGNKSYDVPD